MDTNQSIKAFLDSLSQVPGSILYRDTFEWKALLPGEENQVLTIGADLRPVFQTLSSYRPAWQSFPGGTRFFSRVYTAQNDQVSHVVRLRQNPIPGDLDTYIHSVRSDPGIQRSLLILGSTSHSNINFRNRLRHEVRTGSNVLIYRAISINEVADNEKYSVLASFNASNAASTFIINGENADDLSNPSRVAPATGSLGKGSYFRFNVGATYPGVNSYIGSLSFTGYNEVYISDFSRFFNASGSPKNIESSLSAAWSGNPKFWHESARLDQNRGTHGSSATPLNVNITLPSSW